MRLYLQMTDDAGTGYGEPRDGEPPHRRAIVEGEVCALESALDLVETFLRACGYVWDLNYSLDLVDEWGRTPDDQTTPPPSDQHDMSEI